MTCSSATFSRCSCTVLSLCFRRWFSRRAFAVPLRHVLTVSAPFSFVPCFRGSLALQRRVLSAESSSLGCPLLCSHQPSLSVNKCDIDYNIDYSAGYLKTRPIVSHRTHRISFVESAARYSLGQRSLPGTFAGISHGTCFQFTRLQVAYLRTSSGYADPWILFRPIKI